MPLYFIYRSFLTIAFSLYIALYNLYLNIATLFWKNGQKRKQRKIAVCLRRSFEFLGGTYIKLGQIMSMRPDYFSQEICEELYTLLDSTRPLSFEKANKELKKRLKENYKRIKSIEPVPIGSASFAQVHKAVIYPERIVAIKIQRPGIDRKVRVDLVCLKLLVALIDFSTVFSYIKLKLLYDEFAKWTKEELNLSLEAGNAFRLSRNLGENSDFRVPEIFWELSNEKIITMEVFEGVWLSDVISGRCGWPTAFDAADTASKLIQYFLRQIFVDGFFHADPHPGNIILLKDGKIGLIDFGIIGVMTSDFKRNMLHLLENISRRDSEGAFYWAIKIVKPPKDVDLAIVQKEYEEYVNNWFHNLEIPTKNYLDKATGKLLQLNIKSFQKHRIGLSNIVVQFYRCIILLETVALSLHQQTSLLDEMDFFFKNYEQAELEKRLSVGQIRNVVKSYASLLLLLPERIDKLIDKVSGEGLSFDLHINRFLKSIIVLLMLLSNCLLAAAVILMFKMIFQPADSKVFELNIMTAFIYCLCGGVLARFLRRYISIEFR